MLSNQTIFHFNEKNIPKLSEVGGKGYSLIKMTKAGLEIPSGFVLSVNFFQQWINELKTTEEWFNFKNDSKDEISKSIQLVKEKSLNLTFTNQQRNNLNEALEKMGSTILFAVRSSSPEEDLIGASFAGGYETILGVSYENLEIAIKKAFASCLDYRVFIYKKEKGFNTNDFSIAIVVMRQIASDIAGVGFSINPLNNDYDEIVINSNWGLGETVVGGLANPDQYIINKVTKKIIELKIGKKETSIWLNEKGGTFEKPDLRQDSSSLTEKHLNQILTQIQIIENYYKQPIDIEWAIEQNKLYILQARPITTYLQLPEELMTQPGAPKKLFIDLSLCVQGADKPYSVLGGSILNTIFENIGEKALSAKNIVGFENGIIKCIGGRIYLNLSNLWTKIDKNNMAKHFSNMNKIAGQIMIEADSKYIATKIPDSLNFWKLGMLWRLPASKIAFPTFFLEKIKKGVKIGTEEFDKELENLKTLFKNKKISLGIFVDKMFKSLTYLIITYLLPAVIGGTINGINKINNLFEKLMEKDPKIKNLINELIRSLPNNVTTEMGLEVYRISQTLKKELYPNQQIFHNEFKNKKLPNEFYEKFDNFIKKYGFRGEGELDIKNKRYYEDYNSFLNQIYNVMIHSTQENNPLLMFENVNKNRLNVYEELRKIAIKNNFELNFKNAFTLCYNLLGYRESHKFYVIKCISELKEITLNIAEEFLQKGLILDDTNEIFDLTIKNLIDIDSGKILVSRDQIKILITQNNIIRNIFLSWSRTPSIIDSRGRILTLKSIPAKKGELIGQSTSYGIIEGKVKVLNYVNEKNFEAGEILVTKSTDPGWTPLIISAGGILLEIGGMLQHGALVAREFGKPCIVGIENVTKILKDGDIVEVDAINGIVKIKEKLL